MPGPTMARTKEPGVTVKGVGKNRLKKSSKLASPQTKPRDPQGRGENVFFFPKKKNKSIVL